MPGYVIHLTEASMIADILAKQNDWAVGQREQWKKVFLCGALLPDAVQGEEKQTSHFWKAETEGQVFQIPDLKRFLRKEKLSLGNPILCGYYAHLRLDQIFFEEFMPTLIELRDVQGKEEKRSGFTAQVYLRQSRKAVSIDEFFSEQYLYGDYTQLNHALAEQYQLALPKRGQLPKGECCGIEIDSLDAVLLELERFMQGNKVFDKGLQVIGWDVLINCLKNATDETIKELVLGYDL